MRLRRQAVASWRVSVQQGTPEDNPSLTALIVSSPGRSGVLDAAQRKDQQGCVQISGTMAAGVPADGRVEATHLDLGREGVSGALPAPAFPGGQSISLSDASGSVEGEPAHQLTLHYLRGNRNRSGRPDWAGVSVLRARRATTC